MTGEGTTHGSPSSLSIAEALGGLALRDPVITDDALRRRYADDFGHIVHETPIAVVRPHTAEEVAEVIRFARRHGLGVAVRGAAHTTHGQSQVRGGVVIDMTAMAAADACLPSRMTVQTGAMWGEVVARSLAHGLTPPVLTDFLATTVGGTLSSGGLGTQSYRSGPQTEQILELEVVTGTGEIVTCSREVEPELFDACRGGLGQFGVMTRATLRLEPARPLVRVHRTFHADLDAFIADLITLTTRKELDGLEGAIVPAEPQALAEVVGKDVQSVELPRGAGPWLFMIKATSHVDRDDPPDDAHLLRGLNHPKGACYTRERTYAEFVHRLDPSVRAFEAKGLWSIPHPWINLFLPAAAVGGFIRESLAGLSCEEARYWTMPVYPYAQDAFRTPLLRVPEGPVFIKFGLLRGVHDPAKYPVQHYLAANLRMRARCVELGGVRYPIDNVPMSAADWATHYGPRHAFFERAKARFDPHHLFAAPNREPSR